MNAFTGKEDTCLYASFLSPHLDRASELFSDILFHSVYPAAEIRKEKDVVIDEINYYRDIPDDCIFEDFEAQIFRDHPMGRSVLGTAETVKKINAKAIRSFISHNYISGRILICITGNVNPDAAFKTIGKYFNAPLPFSSITKRKPPVQYTPTTLIIEKDISQAHCVTGIPACSQKDPRRLVLALLNNYLGGPGMNSRLNMSVREKHGLAYNIESNFAPFSDCGIFSIYFGTDNGDCEKAMRLIMREINNLRKAKLGTLQLHRAKQQIKGQLAISLESNLNNMLGAGKSMMAYGQIDSIGAVCDKIDGITATQVLDVAQAILDPLRFSTVIYQPQRNDS
jgi:predicted Zn-dependent peptidase